MVVHEQYDSLVLEHRAFVPSITNCQHSPRLRCAVEPLRKIKSTGHPPIHSPFRSSQVKLSRCPRRKFPPGPGACEVSCREPSSSVWLVPVGCVQHHDCHVHYSNRDGASTSYTSLGRPATIYAANLFSSRFSLQRMAASSAGRLSPKRSHSLGKRYSHR